MNRTARPRGRLHGAAHQSPLVPKPIATACASLLAVFAQASMAEENASSEQKLDTVVVTGIRKSLESSQSIKRNAQGVVDGIVAEDIGKFPDTNLAESMQRIAGVSIDRNTSGEGSKVTVRGVGPEYNLVLLNGRQMPTGIATLTGAGSRAFDFSNLSSDSVTALEVYKTSRAATPTGGIGATINIKTAKPLDSKERIASIGVKAGYDASNSRLPEMYKGAAITPEISGIYSDVFADGKFGVALSGSYTKRNSGSNMVGGSSGWYSFAPNTTYPLGSIVPKPASGTDIITNRPTGIYSTTRNLGYYSTALQQERVNGQLTVQYAPTKDLKFTVDQTLATNAIARKGSQLMSSFGTPLGAITFDGNPDVATPVVQTDPNPLFNKDLAQYGYMSGDKSKLGSTGFNAEWKASPALALNVDVHHSNYSSRPNSPYGSDAYIDLAMWGQGNALASYDQKMPVLSLPGTVYDVKKQQVTGSKFTTNLVDQTVDQVQTSAVYRLGDADKLNVGLGFTRVNNRTANNTKQNNDWAGIGALGDFNNVSVTQAPLADFFSRLPGHADPRLYPSMGVFDFEAVRNRAIEIAMTKGAGPTKQPMTRAQAEAYFAAPSDYTNATGTANDYRTTEKTSSLYAQWDHAFDTAIPMNLSAGLRYESTQVESSSQITTRTSVDWTTGTVVVVNPGPTSFGSGTGKYAYVLPSIDWDADLTSKLKVRASYGENIARPGWNNLLGGLTLAGLAAPTGGSGSTGNPDLKPLHAKNLDLSAEYYYDKSSYVAVTGFYKQVKNFLSTGNVSVTVPGLNNPFGGAYYNAGLANCNNDPRATTCINNYILNTFKGQPGVLPGKITGQPGDPLLVFSVATPTNSSNGDSIKGLEFNAQHMFGNTGFGVSGNFTWVRTGLKYDNASLAAQTALTGVSNSANLVGFFENDKWSVRAAYNWRGEFYAGTFGKTNDPTYTDPYAQIDMSIGYKIGKQLTIQADMLNLNDGYIRIHGRADQQTLWATQTGRRILIGARYKF